MTTFIALVSAYYMCDAAAAQHPLPPDLAQGCAAQYEAVKAEFIDDAETGPQARRMGYLRFKAWERANPDLVARLRADARSGAAEWLGLPGAAPLGTDI